MCGSARFATVFAVTLAVAASARAAEPALTWDAPAGCPTADDVRRDVTRLVGRGLDDSAVRAHGRVTRDGARWHVELEITSRDGSSRRDLDGENCAEVSVAAATVIALTVDPSSAPSSSAPSAGTFQAPVPEPQRAPVSPRVAVRPATSPAPAPEKKAVAAPPPPKLGLAVEAFGSIDARSLPAAAPGFGAGGAVLVAPIRVDLTAAAFAARRATSGAAHADVSLTSVDLRAAWEFRVQRFGLRPGAIGEAGVARAESSGILLPGSGNGRWWAAGIGFTLGIDLGRGFVFDAGADALAILARDQFVILGRGPIYRPPAVTVRGTLGVEWRL